MNSHIQRIGVAANDGTSHPAPGAIAVDWAERHCGRNGIVPLRTHTPSRRYDAKELSGLIKPLKRYLR